MPGAIESIDWSAIRSGLANDYERISNFEFAYDNMLFYIIFVILCVLLIEMWGFKRSFSFCATLSIILLATTRIEYYCKELFSQPGQSFDSTIIKFISLSLITMLFLMYMFTKRS